VLERLERRHARPFKEQLASERGTVERAPIEHIGVG
jgi:hypothetical protein